MAIKLICTHCKGLLYSKYNDEERLLQVHRQTCPSPLAHTKTKKPK